MTTDSTPKKEQHPTPVEQVVGDLRAALKSIGGHGRITLVVEKVAGDIADHRVERSKLTEEDLQRLMQQPPRGWRR